MRHTVAGPVEFINHLLRRNAVKFDFKTVRVLPRIIENIKISKRAGSYITVRDLIEWVGRDAVRFFLVSRRADSEFVFDIDLALWSSASNENPVYYVQYAHARLSALARNAAELGLSPSTKHLDLLTHDKEGTLIRNLGERGLS